MPRKGENYTNEMAMKQGRVPAAPIGRVINRWAEENWWMDFESIAKENPDQDGATRRLAAFTGIHEDTIGKVRTGRKDWLEFDNADKIVTFIDPFLWHRDEELSEMYQGFDFSNLDLTRPTCDELSLLEGLSDRQAAAVMGVSPTTLNRRRREERAA